MKSSIWRRVSKNVSLCTNTKYLYSLPPPPCPHHRLYSTLGTQGPHTDRYDSTLPRWAQAIVDKQLARIDNERNERAKTEESVDLTKLAPQTYKLICRVCEKPNTITVPVCTSCGFRLSKWDVAKVENVFLKIINGEKSHKVLYRDELIVIFEDKFKISDIHLDAIPVDPIVDISHITALHIPLIERLYHKGIEVLNEMVKDIPLYSNKKIEDILITGFNLPVSVQHLHLHLVLPPLYNVNSFKHPRFHPYSKVHQDLLAHGKVVSYHAAPDPVAGELYYQQHVSKPHYDLLKFMKGEN